jgi:hypothetical protein
MNLTLRALLWASLAGGLGFLLSYALILLGGLAWVGQIAGAGLEDVAVAAIFAMIYGWMLALPLGSLLWIIVFVRLRPPGLPRWAVVAGIGVVIAGTALPLSPWGREWMLLHVFEVTTTPAESQGGAGQHD